MIKVMAALHDLKPFGFIGQLALVTAGNMYLRKNNIMPEHLECVLSWITYPNAQVLVGNICLRRTKDMLVGGKPLVDLPTRTVCLVQVQLVHLFTSTMLPHTSENKQYSK